MTSREESRPATAGAHSVVQPSLTRAVVRGIDDGEVIAVGAVDHLFQLVGADTEGRVALERFTLAPAAMGARSHVHRGHDEYFCVLSGELTVHTGDGEVVVTAGGVVAALRGSPHGFRNAGDVP